MKQFILASLMLLQTMAFADTTATRSVVFDGSSEIENLLLQTEKTKTEYREERVRSTCYRIQYRRQCTQRPRTCRRVCNRNNNCRRVCNGGNRVCRDVRVRVPYSCWRYETRAYRVHDYFVETNTTLNFNTSEVDTNTSETFQVEVSGEEDKLTVRGSKNYLVVLRDRIFNSHRNAGTKYNDISYNIDFIKTQRIQETLGEGIQDVKHRKGILRFSIGKNFNLKEFTQNIKIYKYKRIGKDKLLLNRNISENEMEVDLVGDRTHIKIDLNNLGINLPSKMRVILKTSYNIGNGEVLSKGIKTEARSNWIFR